eukprot:TRINITY_DN8647_c1_g1_i1.p1 TRINITY_DN8647_c1_g1~~TRINITY_DN8647_c1_g1_i1.p1  ORF type:complete len:232 (+),score=36.18 TRINITY_DN8647_c1_g1_i1:67-762(+)
MASILQNTYFLLLICCASRAWAAHTLHVGSRQQRETCPFWKAIGVLSDHMELSCGGGYDSSVLTPTARESLALACCPEPYGQCEIAERVDGCDKIIVPILTAPGSFTTPEKARETLQRARGALVEANPVCTGALAPENPHATCNGDLIGGRDDIYCETLLFQTEQLGDGDEGEYKKLGCPFPGKSVQEAAQSKGQRMKRSLKPSQVPEIWQQSQVVRKPSGFLQVHGRRLP